MTTRRRAAGVHGIANQAHIDATAPGVENADQWTHTRFRDDAHRKF
jgi:hypothetical protein